MKIYIILVTLCSALSSLACDGNLTDGIHWASIREYDKKIHFHLAVRSTDQTVNKFSTSDYQMTGGGSAVTKVTFKDAQKNIYSYENTSDIHGGKYDNLVIKGKPYKIECAFEVID